MYMDEAAKEKFSKKVEELRKKSTLKKDVDEFIKKMILIKLID